VSRSQASSRRVKSWWLSAWPLWTLFSFLILAPARMLPAGNVRAAVVLPILLVVPGALTLGVVFSQRSRPQGLVFVCYAALLGVVWLAFASLLLYVYGLLITVDNTFWCLLTVSAVLAVSAEVRLLLARPGSGRRVADKPRVLNPDISDSEMDEVGRRTAAGGMTYYAAIAVAAGISLLATGLYAYDHLPHPNSTGYTWMAWTGPQVNGAIAIGSGGTELHFEIVHREMDKTTFHLSAKWMGIRSAPLAKPVTFTIGPNRTSRGFLLVPSLPNGCTYRLVVALTAARQIDPFTKRAQTWSINADVHDPKKSIKTCKR
jgi:hypothetical protein